jgi:hypothetical protein
VYGRLRAIRTSSVMARAFLDQMRNISGMNESIYLK